MLNASCGAAPMGGRCRAGPLQAWGSGARKNIHPKAHTRLPRYGAAMWGGRAPAWRHVFPDSVVAGKGEDPQWLYTVCFDAQELWGADADPTVSVSIEAFEPYLEHV